MDPSLSRSSSRLRMDQEMSLSSTRKLHTSRPKTSSQEENMSIRSNNIVWQNFNKIFLCPKNSEPFRCQISQLENIDKDLSKSCKKNYFHLCVTIYRLTATFSYFALHFLFFSVHSLHLGNVIYFWFFQESFGLISSISQSICNLSPRWTWFWFARIYLWSCFAFWLWLQARKPAVIQ